MSKKIGLSFVQCVLDIATGKVDMNDVTRIVCGTRCQSVSDWNTLIALHKGKEWVACPNEAENIARLLIMGEMIEQTRITLGSKVPDLSHGRWIDEGAEIKYIPSYSM